MLRQVFIIKGDDIIYQWIFGNALSLADIENLHFRMKQDAMKKAERPIGYFDHYKYRVAYKINIERDLIFIFVSGLMDDFFGLIQTMLNNFHDEFLDLFDGDIDEKLDSEKILSLDSLIDSFHNEIKPKIAVVGFSGVGKTTIKNLIKLGEVPLKHIPTISGDIATIKIDKLEFTLFDFAGQEQYKYLWKGFIKGSNAVLVITDSTPINVEKSRYFIALRNEEAPYARIAIIGNKQDLDHSMKVENIENILGLKTYPMIANRPENQDKMNNILVDILDLNRESSPLIESIPERKELDIGDKDEIITRKEVSVEKVEEGLIGINLDPKLNSEVINDIKGVQIENILRNHLNMINTTIKVLNNDEEQTFEEFYDNYQDYTQNAFVCRNAALKPFLETQFAFLQKAVQEDEFLATKLKDDKDIIMNALLCAYLSIANPFKYPIWETISNQFPFESLDAETVKEVHAYYLRIMNKISK